MVSMFGWIFAVLLLPVMYFLYSNFYAKAELVRVREEENLAADELLLRSVEALSMAIEAKDRNSHKHMLRIRAYCEEIGLRKGLDEQTLKALVTAAMLHDVGELAVPQHIINKPGKLTPDEFEKMKLHPLVGADVLTRVKFPYPVVPIVRSHHEAWDGTGYPDGLKGEQIPIGARILTVVDCFDAVAAERPYRRAVSLEEAMDHIRQGAGTQFDPEIVELLAGCYRELEAKALQTIDVVKPLDARLLVHREPAPGAGFAYEADLRRRAEAAAPGYSGNGPVLQLVRAERVVEMKRPVLVGGD